VLVQLSDARAQLSALQEQLDAAEQELREAHKQVRVAGEESGPLPSLSCVVEGGCGRGNGQEGSVWGT